MRPCRPGPCASAAGRLLRTRSGGLAQAEGRTVAADSGPDELRLLAGCKPQQLIAAEIDEIPVAVRMPERPFGENEAGGEALGFSGLEHSRQVIGDGHC